MHDSDLPDRRPPRRTPLLIPDLPLDLYGQTWDRLRHHSVERLHAFKEVLKEALAQKEEAIARLEIEIEEAWREDEEAMAPLIADLDKAAAEADERIADPDELAAKLAEIDKVVKAVRRDHNSTFTLKHFLQHEAMSWGQTQLQISVCRRLILHHFRADPRKEEEVPTWGALSSEEQEDALQDSASQMRRLLLGTKGWTDEKFNLIADKRQTMTWKQVWAWHQAEVKRLGITAPAFTSEDALRSSFNTERSRRDSLSRAATDVAGDE